MAAATGARRRRSTNGSKQAANPLASPRFGRRLFAAMAVLAAGYAGLGLYRIAHGARNYGLVYMGMSRPEVRYVLGAPAAQAMDGTLWRMRDGDAETTVLFDDADRVTAVGCRGVSASGGGDCSDVLGVRVSDNESAVWDRLGFPASEVYGDGTKIMAYPALGIRVKLRRTTVVAIEHRHVSGVVPFALKALSLLAP